VFEAVNRSPIAAHGIGIFWPEGPADGRSIRKPRGAGTLECIVDSARDDVGLCVETALLEALCMAVDGSVQLESGRRGVTTNIVKGGRCF
jgi:hypothetical protein